MQVRHSHGASEFAPGTWIGYNQSIGLPWRPVLVCDALQVRPEGGEWNRWLIAQRASRWMRLGARTLG